MAELTQQNLLFTDPSFVVSEIPRKARIHGEGIDATEKIRLTQHLIRFINFVKDGRERTLGEVADALHMMQTSASARWRNIKDLGGAYEKRKDEKIKGLYWYRLTRVPEGFGEV